jgi:hypothetical protein
MFVPSSGDHRLFPRGVHAFTLEEVGIEFAIRPDEETPMFANVTIPLATDGPDLAAIHIASGITERLGVGVE